VEKFIGSHKLIKLRLEGINGFCPHYFVKENNLLWRFFDYLSLNKIEEKGERGRG